MGWPFCFQALRRPASHARRMSRLPSPSMSAMMGDDSRRARRRVRLRPSGKGAAVVPQYVAVLVESRDHDLELAVVVEIRERRRRADRRRVAVDPHRPARHPGTVVVQPVHAPGAALNDHLEMAVPVDVPHRGARRDIRAAFDHLHRPPGHPAPVAVEAVDAVARRAHDELLDAVLVHIGHRRRRHDATSPDSSSRRTDRWSPDWRLRRGPRSRCGATRIPCPPTSYAKISRSPSPSISPTTGLAQHRKVVVFGHPGERRAVLVEYEYLLRVP